MCICVGVSVGVCLCSFMFGLHCYWLDCSHPPIHPIATIATDGAASINAPGSASLINGRLTNISDLQPLSVVTFESSCLIHPPVAVYHGCLLHIYISFCSTLLDHFVPTLSVHDFCCCSSYRYLFYCLFSQLSFLMSFKIV